MQVLGIANQRVDGRAWVASRQLIFLQSRSLRDKTHGFMSDSKTAIELWFITLRRASATKWERGLQCLRFYPENWTRPQTKTNISSPIPKMPV
jgi:hypothetical protein